MKEWDNKLRVPFAHRQRDLSLPFVQSKGLRPTVHKSEDQGGYDEMRLLLEVQLLEELRCDNSFESMNADEAQLHCLFVVYQLAKLA